ncbi:hypothetical protein BDW02DRAFT_564084 [Decorospora gaudefroyi]|uniref:Uncharacterized protein n=1 Tax=Decorospora gaudefroyi TaxID=184978 RepID=A0A6A5L017_9PLEO|nr:hypothetical protein BDW02DRAFT_564084 [Decorospora gaudefroyi]
MTTEGTSNTYCVHSISVVLLIIKLTASSLQPDYKCELISRIQSPLMSHRVISPVVHRWLRTCVAPRHHGTTLLTGATIRECPHFDPSRNPMPTSTFSSGHQHHEPFFPRPYCMHNVCIITAVVAATAIMRLPKVRSNNIVIWRLGPGISLAIR